MKKYLMLVLIFSCISLTGCSSWYYKKADKLYEEGKYQAALEYYNKSRNSSDYKEASDSKIKKCGYRLAEEAKAEGNWITAFKYYEDLSDSEQEKYCKQEWINKLAQKIFKDFGITDATIIEFKYEDEYSMNSDRESLLYEGITINSSVMKWKGYPIFHSNKFGSLSDEKKLEFFDAIYDCSHVNGYYVAIQTDTHTYRATYSKNRGWNLEKIDNESFNLENHFERGKSSGSISNKNSGDKCHMCNGTGYQKYNYGGSDLEAILSGHDTYTTGICGSCGGTGKS